MLLIMQVQYEPGCREVPRAENSAPDGGETLVRSTADSSDTPTEM